MTLHYTDTNFCAASKLKYPQLSAPQGHHALGLIHRHAPVPEACLPMHKTILDDHLEADQGEQPKGNASHHHHPENHEGPGAALSQGENQQKETQ